MEIVCNRGCKPSAFKDSHFKNLEAVENVSCLAKNVENVLCSTKNVENFAVGEERKKKQQNRPVADSCWCIWSQLKDNRNEIQPVKQGKDLAIEF